VEANPCAGLGEANLTLPRQARDEMELMAQFAKGNQEKMARELRTHIIVFAHRIDFDALIARRRHP
jgi:hypothetical protein